MGKVLLMRSTLDKNDGSIVYFGQDIHDEYEVEDYILYSRYDDDINNYRSYYDNMISVCDDGLFRVYYI